MYIPNCRTDKYYNYDALKPEDRIEINGFDWAVKSTVESFFDNIGDFVWDVDSNTCDINVCKILENHKDVREKLKKCLLDSFEMTRNETIVSMIDNYSDDCDYISDPNKVIE